MTFPSTPPLASADDLRPTWRGRMMLAILLFSLLYSGITLVREWGPAEKEKSLTGGLPSLQAILFQNGTRLDLYDAQNPFVRFIQESEQNRSLLIPPRLLSPKAILIGEGATVRVRDMSSTYTYPPLASDQKSSLVFLSRNTNFTYSIPDGPDHTHLHIDFSRCGEIADIPLPAEEPWYKADRLFDSLTLPKQKKMVLSPAETTLVLVHHDVFPRMTLVHLIARQAAALSVPSFDPEQLHFSPFFIDDQTLLFSVLDRYHWGTVRYNILTGTYEVLSQNFTDHAYHSLSGNVILQQSFYDETINVPFGSLALLDQTRGIPVQEIAALIGQQEQQAGLYSLLFQQPKESVLHFRTDLTTASFNVIAPSDVRELLRTFWRDYQLKLSQSVGVLRLQKLESDDTFTPVETIPFEIHAPATFIQFIENAEPLLKALEVPVSLIEEYRKRSTEAKEAGAYYTLVDDLSY
ncbi:MAG: hypothetical protein PHX87_01100 [Candidatus Peribacteraceae bacterium]|nr:hypothetical protein [Candidatus Peribacteraceae bacterium]MDD5742007.1 hypothetical protein [Candidatus Peribacteraceae bacterium]